MHCYLGLLPLGKRRTLHPPGLAGRWGAIGHDGRPPKVPGSAGADAMQPRHLGECAHFYRVHALLQGARTLLPVQAPESCTVRALHRVHAPSCSTSALQTSMRCGSRPGLTPALPTRGHFLASAVPVQEGRVGTRLVYAIPRRLRNIAGACAGTVREEGYVCCKPME